MAYETTNPPILMTSGLNSAVPNTWVYKSTEAAAGVDLDGYITNGVALGMRVYDIVYVYDTDASPVIVTIHRVASVNADGSVDLTNGGILITGTDSD